MPTLNPQLDPVENAIWCSAKGIQVCHRQRLHGRSACFASITGQWQEGSGKVLTEKDPERRSVLSSAVFPGRSQYSQMQQPTRAIHSQRRTTVYMKV